MHILKKRLKISDATLADLTKKLRQTKVDHKNSTLFKEVKFGNDPAENISKKY